MSHCLPSLTIFSLAALGTQRGAMITTAPAGSTTTLFATGSTCTSGTDAGFTITGSACWPDGGYFGFGTDELGIAGPADSG